MNRFRTGVVLTGYLILAVIVGLGTTWSVPAPPKINVVVPTEAQIKEQVKNEQEARRSAHRVARETSAARVVYRANGCRLAERDGLSVLTGRAAYEYGISARVLAAVIYVESSCNSRAISGRDSVGLAQINYRVWKQHTREEYLNPEINVRTGAQILSQYIHRYGVEKGLHAYNGFGNPTNEYASKVLLAAGMA